MNLKLTKASTRARIFGAEYKGKKRDKKHLFVKNLHNKLMFYTIFFLFLLNICLWSTTDELVTENNMMKLKLHGLDQQYKLMNDIFLSFLASQVTYFMFLWWCTKENSDHHCAIQTNTHNLFMHEVSWRWMMTYRFLIVNLYHMFMFFPSWLYEVWTLGSICYT